MSIETRRQHLDVAFFNFRGDGEHRQRKGNICHLIVMAVVFLFIGAIIGYFYCVETGRYPPPDVYCCGDGLNFDFNFSPPGI